MPMPYQEKLDFYKQVVIAYVRSDHSDETSIQVAEKANTIARIAVDNLETASKVF